MSTNWLAATRTLWQLLRGRRMHRGASATPCAIRSDGSVESAIALRHTTSVGAEALLVELQALLVARGGHGLRERAEVDRPALLVRPLEPECCIVPCASALVTASASRRQCAMAHGLWERAEDAALQRVDASELACGVCASRDQVMLLVCGVAATR